MSTPPALYAIVARTQAGKARIAAGLAGLLPTSFPAVDFAWRCLPDAGLAMHAPQVVERQADGVLSLLCLRGTLYGETADTLQSLMARGDRALDTMRGEFAFAFWDGARQQLLLARDHMGQRSLFVREDRDFYLICSELAPLLADPAFDCRLDIESAVHYLQFGQPAPGRTLARQVTRVPAAHLLRWNGVGPMLRQRYFTPIGFDEKKVIDNDDDRDRIAQALDQAIVSRITPERQGILLSGGVDSSYIAVTAAQQAGGSHFDAYTVAFSAPFKHNEGQYARIVTEAHGIRHHDIPFDTAQAHAALEVVLDAAEPCSAWASMTHHHLLSQIGRDGHGSLLSGLGSDEVFGGYWKYFQAYARQRRHELSWPVGDRVAATDGLMWSPGAARAKLFAGIPRFFPDQALRAALHEPYRSWNHGAHLVEFYRECRRLKHDAHLFELMVAHECQHRIPELLFAGFETLSRQHGIRTAYPFLTPEVVKQACALGATERFWRQNGRWRNKRLLRELAGVRVPAEIMARPLHSYTAPIVMWLQDPKFGGTVTARLRDSGLWDTGLIDPQWLATVEREVATHLHATDTKRFNYVEQLWALLTLAAWHARWVERKT